MASNISVTGWYAIAAGSALAILILYRLMRSCRHNLRTWLNRHLVYPTLVSRITRIQAALLLVYIAINTFVLVFPLKNAAELSQRAALVSTINMIPLFLGGRTSPLADLANVSLETYYFWHFWMGRIAVIQGLLHAGLSLSQRRSRGSAIVVSGWIVASLLMLVLLSSVPIIRKRFYALYIKLHFLLVLGTLGGLIWHALTERILNKAPVFVAAGLWTASNVYRGLLYLWWGRNASVEESWSVNQATYLTVHFPKPIRPYPGMYFYLYFSRLPLRYRFQGFPMTALFWRVSPGETVTEEVHFLVQHRVSLPAVTAGHSLRQVLFEGPYGKNLRLETYETVILIAEGIGIAGILPYALHLAQRRHHDERFKATSTSLYRDVTRKVDVLWKLGRNEEEEWCHKRLTDLMNIDTKKTLVSGRLFYPSDGPRKLHIPSESAKFWKCYSGYADKLVDENIDHYIKWNSYSPGKAIVMVCGTPKFSQRIREFIVTAPRLQVDFIEPEFMPRSPSYRDTAIAPKSIREAAGSRQRSLSLLQPSRGNQNRKIAVQDIEVSHRAS